MVVKRIGPYLLKAPNTIAFQKEKDPLNVNFLAIFWHFPNPLIKLNQKMLQEQGKVKKVAKWVTLKSLLYNLTLTLRVVMNFQGGVPLQILAQSDN